MEMRTHTFLEYILWCEHYIIRVRTSLAWQEQSPATLIVYFDAEMQDRL